VTSRDEAGSTLDGKVATSKHRSACVWVSLLVALSGASVAHAAGFDPVVKPTLAGMAAAHRALVTGGELGSSWTQGLPFTPSASAIPCQSLKPDQSDLVETGVGGTSFDRGPWLNVTAATRVFATDTQAEDSWRHTNGAALVQCYERSLEGDGEKLQSARHFPFPSSAQHSAGFRLVMTTAHRPTLGKGPALLVRVYTDVFALSSGRTQELVAFSSLTGPLSHGFEGRIVRQVGERLTSRPTA
jgi:hypothetical protein